jgi:hypothetical protein
MNEASTVHTILKGSYASQFAVRVNKAAVFRAFALSLGIESHPSIVFAITVFVELDTVASR